MFPAVSLLGHRRPLKSKRSGNRICFGPPGPRILCALDKERAWNAV